MKLRFDFDEEALLGTALSRGAMDKQWVAVPPEVSSTAALEQYLRTQPWGGWMHKERLAFLYGEGEVQGDTAALVGEGSVKVVVGRRWRSWRSRRSWRENCSTTPRSWKLPV